MAFHFRKFSHTLRFIPPTKTLGFSTRVSEGDQTKNACLEGSISQSLVVSTADSITRAVLCQHDKSNACAMYDPYPVLTSHNESDHCCQHLHQPAPEMTLPVSYKDLVQILFPRPPQGSNGSSEDPSSLMQLIKSVDLTNDDILVQPQLPGLNKHPDDISTREKVAVDVLTHHSYSLLANRLAMPSLESLALHSVILNNHSLQTFSAKAPVQGQPETQWYCSSGGNSKNNGQSKNGPTPAQLHDAKSKVEELVFKLFKGHHNYELLHKNVVMENNLFGDNKPSIGINAYKIELSKLRLRTVAQYSSTSMEILSVTTQENNGVIRIHWRLKGLSHIQYLKFWQKSVPKEDWEWFEAFSYFHIGKDGLVHKHKIDRMMPDHELEPDKLTEKLRGLLNPAKPLVS
ncbi:uncharacterized protein LOC131934049 [Physella acuta]|uniref:uncharacterized protein LOC131934049 n=1 Tax=Physella acuta TaxID=109671 RepID=UPI0027DC9290|nr:uncharacterized protein LOC131934049 [Physella acuta]